MNNDVYKCHICGKYFDSQKILGRHKKWHYFKIKPEKEPLSIITIYLSDQMIDKFARLKEEGIIESRSKAIRTAVRLFLKKEKKLNEFLLS